MTENTTAAAFSIIISLVIILITVMVMKSLMVIIFTVMILVVYSRTSLSGRLQNNRASVPLTSIRDASVASSSPPSPSVPASSSRSRNSRKYDVFLSFRGKDTRKTFVDHLYSDLVERVTCTYKDDVTLSRGDTILPSLENAIEESQIAIIIFSENYANSTWCLDELAFIMKCREERDQIVVPIFYHVDPSDVRKQKNKYEEAFAKHESANDNKNKVESWRKALVAAGNIAGWEINHNVNEYEAKCIKDIVGTIFDKLLYLNSSIDENLVGMGTRLQDLKSYLEIGSRGVRMVGIWGIGGGGKTTLASSLYTDISTSFDSFCFLGNIKDESSKHGLETLQGKIMSTLLKINGKVEVPSVDIGKQMIKRRLCRKNVLLVLDDIDDRKQLEALAGSSDWFGDDSRIIITTRDEHLLRAHKVDKVYNLSLLSDEEAIRLFNKHAYNDNNVIKDYKMLSQHIVTYAAGLPLALIVLGSFLYDKDNDEWISTLNRLKDIPETEIVQKLRISYDGLKPLEKELFLDIACFWRRSRKDGTKEILEACGLHPGIGIKVLIQKALVTINSYDQFDMHDLIQEMGLFIIRGDYPKNPEKHSRLFVQEEIEDMCAANETMKNNRAEAIKCMKGPSNIGKLVSHAKKLRMLDVNKTELINKEDIEVPSYLSNKLRYMSWGGYQASSFPECFEPRKLVVLKLHNCLLKVLWRSYKCLPCLKELQLYSAYNLVKTPDFDGLPCLQKLALYECSILEEIHPSLGNHSSLVYVSVINCGKLRNFPTIVQMGKLEILKISYCKRLHTFPEIKANMDGLVELSLDNVGIKDVPSTVGKYCTELRSLTLKDCSELKSIEWNFLTLRHLQNVQIYSLRKHIKLPKDLFSENICLEKLQLTMRQSSIPHLPCFLTKLSLYLCRLKDGEIPSEIGELSNLQELDLSRNDFSRINISLLQLTQLKLFKLESCRKLVELPELPTSIAILNADWCLSLEVVEDIYTNCKWLCQVSIRKGRSVIGGEKLLQSMLQGNAIKSGCMRLQLGGLEIPKGLIIPRLLSGNSYIIELRENWYNHFSGFLICAATGNRQISGVYISMIHENSGTTDSEKEMYWEESVEDVETWVGYISFASLKDTSWWDETTTAIEFIFVRHMLERKSLCSGFSVYLVPKTSESCQIPTTTYSCSQVSDVYTCNFSIVRDSKSYLKCLFLPEKPNY